MGEYSWKQKWLAITPKPFAAVSIIGSLYIVRHVLTSPKRRSTVFHRILLGLSTYDFMTSTAVLMGTWPIPRGTPGVFMASGNSATCSAQGFFIQLGVGTPLYNASLSTYYFLYIFMGWKEGQLKKVEPILHLFPILFSLGTAVAAAATDSYRGSNVWCWITSSNNGFRFGFFYGFVWGALALVTIQMAAISAKVLVIERRASKYRLPAKVPAESSTPNAPRTESATQQVTIQALFYVFSFYLTFVFPSWTRISQMVNGSAPFAATALFAVFFPMQGMFNSMVYFRPRFLKYRRKHPDLNVLRVIFRGVIGNEPAPGSNDDSDGHDRNARTVEISSA